jgi:hypothetical protein
LLLLLPSLPPSLAPLRARGTSFANSLFRLACPALPPYAALPLGRRDPGSLLKSYFGGCFGASNATCAVLLLEQRRWDGRA